MEQRKGIYADSENIRMQHIFGLVARRRWFIIVPLILSLILGILASIFLPRSYEASSTVLVKSQQMVDPLVSRIAVSPDIRELLDTLSRQVLAWPKLEQLVDQLNMDADFESPIERESYIKALKDRIGVSLRSRELIQITYYDEDPGLAQKVVNTLTLNFIDENKRTKREEARNAIDFISEQLKIYKKKLEYSQQNFSSSKVESELRLAYNRKQLLEARLKNLQKLIPSQITREQSPIMAELNSQMGQLQGEYARLMIDAKEGHPRVKELETIIAQIKKKIDQEKGKETVKESIEITNPQYLEASQDLQQVEMEIDYLSKRQVELEDKTGVVKEPVTEEDLASLERDKTVDEDIYQMLLEQLEAAYVSERLQESEKTGRFTIIEYARIPLKPSRPNILKVILAGLLAGCALSAGLVYFIEYIDKSFTAVEDAKDFLPLPVLGTVSRMNLPKQHILENGPVKGKPGLMENLMYMLKVVQPVKIWKKKDSSLSPFIFFHHDIRSRIAEEYRVLWTNLLSLKMEKKPDIIMVTSSIHGEGKSVSSSNIAAAMAYTGKKTLLIDFDLRKGTIGELFGLTNRRKGVSELLRTKGDAMARVVETEVPNLSVLPRGEVIVNPSEVLDADRIDALIKELKNNFDMIIIDAPPVLQLPDVAIIGKNIDTVLVVVQMARTYKDDVIETYNNLIQNNIQIRGFVLNCVRYYLPGYLYNYYYGDYYSYGNNQ